MESKFLLVAEDSPPIIKGLSLSPKDRREVPDMLPILSDEKFVSMDYDVASQMLYFVDTSGYENFSK